MLNKPISSSSLLQTKTSIKAPEKNSSISTLLKNTITNPTLKSIPSLLNKDESMDQDEL